MDETVLQAVRDAPLSDLAPLLRVIRDRGYEYRLSHNGRAPLELFEPFIILCGAYLAVGVAVRVGGIFALKPRTTPEEQSGRGQYQFAEVTACQNEGLEVFDRLSREIYGPYPPQGITAIWHPPYAGTVIQNEPERLATCFSIMHVLEVNRLDYLSPEWKLFPNLDEPGIVDHQRETLKWLSKNPPPGLVDLRLHRETNWLEHAKA